ncbi:MAG: hypothetical protein RIT45_1268 [Pseudomonadota bacterium]
MEDVEQPALLSIGALAQATGIPTATLRTWERRYGFPRPVRTESGHRRYRLADARILEHVRDLLAEGHRAADVLAAGPDRIRTLCAFAGGADAPTSSEASDAGGAPAARAADDAPTPSPPAAPTPTLDPRAVVEGLHDAVLRLDAVAFLAGLQVAWARLGTLAAIERVVGPLLVGIGEGWRAGRVEILHEHFASERLRDFLAEQWRPLASRAPVRVVATTLPGERHVLGLHLCATVLAHSGLGVVFLGAETPISDVPAALDATGAVALVLSSAAGADPGRVRSQLLELRDQTPDSVTILIGGQGAMEVELPLGVRRVHDLASLSDWATSRRLSRESAR